jgi:hypothetical protein
MTALQDKFLPEGISRLLKQSTRFSHSFHVGGNSILGKKEENLRKSNLNRSKRHDNYSEESKDFVTKVDRNKGFDGYQKFSDVARVDTEKLNLYDYNPDRWNEEKPVEYIPNRDSGYDGRQEFDQASQERDNAIRKIEEIDDKKRALSEITVKPAKNLNTLVSKVTTPFGVNNDTKKKYSEFDRQISVESSKSDGQSVDVWRASEDMDKRPINQNNQPANTKDQLLDQWLGHNDDNDTITEDVDAENEDESQRNSRFSKIKSVATRESEVKKISNDDEEENELHKIHMLQSLQALQYMKKVSLPPMEELKSRFVFLPPPKLPHIKKTLIFDMDETLIHCVDDIDVENPQVVLDVIFEDGEVVEAGVNVRPFAID